MTPAEQLKENILSLEQKLLAATPDMPILLRTIHNHIKSDPELVTCLDEADIAIIVNGLKKQTNTEIATVAKKKTIKSIGLADL